jgi:uncharacterized protein (DUF1501 family)
MNPTLHTRRHFLRTTFLGGAAAWTIPAFLERTFFAMDAQAAQSLLPTPDGRDHPILIVVQLAGGNDGLNTLIPHGSDPYYRARPRLSVPAGKVLALNDDLGLHPSLTGLRSLYDDGYAALIQGVGYPNPNRSHFRSTDIWQTGSDAGQELSQGWLGRYFDACCAGEDATTGIAIGNREPLAFTGENAASISFNQPGSLRLQGIDAMEMDSMLAEAPMDGNDEPGLEDMAGASIGALPGGNILDSEGASNVDFLRRVAMDARMGSDTIRQVTNQFKASTPFPANRLGRDLELVARLIAGSMPTRVYYVSQGGYDTHSNQLNTHARLLAELDGALSALARELQAQGNWSRVLVMTFSEFGRRVAENASGGTDHGAAAPLFILGGGVRPGVHGRAPSLENLDRGDLIHTTDFRSVYATVLEQWLRAPSQQILHQKFPLVDFLRPV